MDIDSDDLWDTGAELSEVNRRRIKYLFDNNEYDLPNDHRPDSHKNGHTYPSIDGRLRWDQPELSRRDSTLRGAGVIYIRKCRGRSPRTRRARIQDFPALFEFRMIDGNAPTRTKLANMISDAVPPPIGYMAGVTALAAMYLGGLSVPTA